MKILAIRGQNLASLPKVEIDLEGGPLADSRLFAITGPTGAGKSTLLDALCLALYDRVPRLMTAREAAGDELELPASDPRSVVRRGSATAMAQVDFRARDGQRLRATWQAWRARKKSSGKMQPQRMSLVDLEDETDLTGATKTETLGLIRDRVGMSFDEFRRAVLLAQGDFAAFLAAKPDERAALLEHMTGTQLYAALSVRAFERAKEEDAKLKGLEVRKEGLNLLPDPDRAELQAQVTVARGRQVTLDARTETARAQVAWYETRGRLEAETKAALEAKAAAEQAWTDAEPQRRDLALFKEAELLRPAQRALRTAEETAQRAAARVATAEQAVASTGADLQARTAQFEITAQHAAEFEADQRARAPELAEARALDGALLEATEAEQTAKAQVDLRIEAERGADAARRAAQDRLEALDREQQTLDAWLEGQAPTRVVAAQWPRWSEELGRYAAAHGRSEAARGVESSAAEVAKKAVRREQEARARLEEVVGRLSAAQRERRALAERLGASREEASNHALSQATARLAEHRANVEAMRGLALDARRAHAARREADTDRAAAETERAARQAALDTLRGEHAEAHAALDAARARDDALRLIAAQSEALLRDGAPCPLCGAPHDPDAGHPRPEPPAEPASDDATALDERLTDLGARIRAEEAAHARQQHEVERAAEDARRAEARLEEARTTWKRHLARLEEAWLESPLLAKHGVQKVALLLPRAPKLTGSTTEVSEALAHLDTLRDALLAETETQESLSTRVDEIRAKEEGLQSRRGATQAEVDAAHAARAKSEQVLAEARREAESAQAQMGEAVRTLDDAFSRWPGWPERLEQAPGGFREEAEARVQAFEARVKARQDIEPARTSARGEHAVATKTHGLAAKALEEARADHGTRDARLEALRTRRASLIEGRDVDAWESERRARAEAITLAHRAADQARAAAKQAAAVADAELATARAAADEAQRTRALEAEALDAALARSSVPDRDALERMLDRGPGWLEALAEALAELDAARVRAESTHADREQRLQAHLATEAPAITEVEAREDFAQAKEDLQALVHALAALRAQLDADDEARARLSDLLPAIQSQRAELEQWSEMSALIGSADGKKLRTFAQGLTLDVLVEQSNLHLEALRPRYTLRRVRGQAMELAVVDHDLGDETRFISTLSGGERFLVSLALALGLSTLSSRNVRIESLFIDEGFGALDRDTLEIALATLDQLQAEGRTVGIISHVADLADRIGYRVEVRPTGPGTSEVHVVGV